jgi:hypothetical protein
MRDQIEISGNIPILQKLKVFLKKLFQYCLEQAVKVVLNGLNTSLHTNFLAAPMLHYIN